MKNKSRKAKRYRVPLIPVTSFKAKKRANTEILPVYQRWIEDEGKMGLNKEQIKSGERIMHKAKRLGSAGGGAISILKNWARYIVKMNTSRSTVVEIIDKAAKPIKGKSTWWIRFDNPHKNVNYAHINANPKITGVPDPHTAISSAQLSAVGKTGKVLECINKAAPFLAAVAVAIDCVRVGYNVVEDKKNGTTRNTVTTVTTTAAAWGCGYGGTSMGAAVGSAVFPGIGTLVGAIVGGVAAGISGNMAAEAIIDGVADAKQYDLEIRDCEKCGNKFNCRIYINKECYICPNCDNDR